MSKARHPIFHIMLEYVTQAAMLGVIIRSGADRCVPAEEALRLAVLKCL